MKLTIFAALILAVTIWIGTCLGHWANRKASEADRRHQEQIEELSR